MSAVPSSAVAAGTCPLCQQTCSTLIVTVEGSLLGCEQCAGQLVAKGKTLTFAEWEAPSEVANALAAFGCGQHTLSKTAFAPVLRPRAHVWFVTTPSGRTLVLRRQDGAPSPAAVLFEAELRQELARARLPVAPFLPTSAGALYWADAASALWTLHEAPAGTPFASDQAFWGQVGIFCGQLAQMHARLWPIAARGTLPIAGDCWTMEGLRACLADWPALSTLTHELRDRAVERLESNKTFEILATLPQTIIHGNLGRAAIFMEGFSLSGICEFERMHRAPAMYDFAFGLISQHRPHARAAVAAYESKRPLQDAERNVLPEVVLLGTLIRADRQLTIWHDEARANELGKTIVYLLDHPDDLRALTSPARPPKAPPMSSRE